MGLTKSELDGKTRVKSNPLAIPKKLKDEYGLAHIGGISYSKADNCIYAGLEDSKVWKYPVVAVYDADTLKFTGRYYVLDNTRHTRGLRGSRSTTTTVCSSPSTTQRTRTS